MKKTKQCFKCKKPAFGYYCKSCFSKKGTRVSQMRIQKRYRRIK